MGKLAIGELARYGCSCIQIGTRLQLTIFSLHILSLADGNQLRSLPIAIGQLTKLQVLRVGEYEWG